MSKKMYGKIKKYKGEKYAKDLRDFHSGIFDIPDLDRILRWAEPTPVPAQDIKNFLVTKLLPNAKKGQKKECPFKLLRKAGYDAFLADSREKQDSIKDYFRENEELCTFGTNRFKNYHVVHCVRNDADTVEYAPEGTPKREDAYGTSVISIQMKDGFISIKNRYNHTVSNPDNTFNSDPDKIIPGLTEALAKEFNVTLEGATGVPENHVLADNRLVYYYWERSGIYVGNYTWVDRGEVHVVNPDYQVLLDHMLVDVKQKTIKSVTGDEDDFIRIVRERVNDTWKLSMANRTIQIGTMFVEFSE